MKLSDLSPGDRFLQPATGLCGVLEDLRVGGARVRLERFRDVVVQGERKARIAEVTTWSIATEVEVRP